jgi:hypothetical protein
LKKNEQEKVAGIVVNLWTTSGQTATYSFSKKVMLQVSEKGGVYRALSQKIIEKNFKYIDDSRDVTKIEEPFADKFKAYIDHLESNLGKLKSFEPFGIREVDDEYGHEFHFFGHLVFENGFFPYKIDLDVNPENDKWVGILLQQGID